MKTITESKERALAHFLGIKPNEVFDKGDYFEADGGEYLVLDDNEADEKAFEYISESLWACRPEFIIEHMEDVEDYDATLKSISTIQREQCESANPIIFALIGGRNKLKDFVEDAISADGRGHFLAGYDFEENEADGFFIYRTN